MWSQLALLAVVLAIIGAAIWAIVDTARADAPEPRKKYSSQRKAMKKKTDWPVIIGGICVTVIALFLFACALNTCSGMLRTMP